MLIIVLLIHFVYGGFAPMVFKKVFSEHEEYKRKTDWLHIGYIYHRDYMYTRKRVLWYCLVMLAYLFLYGLIIVFSLHLLTADI
jgi:hypothetical protein